MLFLTVLAIGEASILIKFFARFSEEIFTLIVAVFFAYQSGLQLYQVCAVTLRFHSLLVSLSHIGC
jgi:hypothetical protein